MADMGLVLPLYHSFCMTLVPCWFAPPSGFERFLVVSVSGSSLRFESLPHNRSVSITVIQALQTQWCWMHARPKPHLQCHASVVLPKPYKLSTTASVPCKCSAFRSVACLAPRLPSLPMIRKYHARFHHECSCITANATKPAQQTLFSVCLNLIDFHLW
jgi:hypothetical protein